MVLTLPRVHRDALELADLLTPTWPVALHDLQASGVPLNAVTLAESAKLAPDEWRRGIIETFMLETPLLELLPFDDINGSAFRYNEEATLPGTEFRAVNSAYTESTGTVNQKTESLVILGGDADVDRFIVQTRGNLNDQRATQEALKSKSLARKFQDAFINGDTAVDANSFDGLKKRLAGTQVIDASAAAGGLPVVGAAATDQHAFFDAVDNLLAAVAGNVALLLMHRTIRGRFRSAARRIGGFETTRDDFGRPIDTYNGIRLADIGQKPDGSEIISLTEPSGGGTPTNNTSSIYAVAFSEGEDEPGVMGLNNGGVMIDDLGQLESKPVYRTRIETYPGLAVFGRGGARLRYVSASA